MHILLTDISSCPRCGPGFGLILLVDEALDRQVLAGALACANCRERYPITNGVGDFTMGEGADFGPAVPLAAAIRLVALAGVTAPPSRLLLVGPAAAHAAAAAALVPDVQIVAAGAAADLDTVEAELFPTLSRLLVTDALPFYGGRFAGVVLSGGAVGVLLAEAARVLGPGGRLVLEPAVGNSREQVTGAGLEVLAMEGATLVAVRS